MSEITLLIPCFNAEKFLPRLFASVTAQTRPFDRILCYDDGSTDATVAIAQELGLDIITGQPNRGAAHARNRLAAAAHTEWFHFHDPDDLLDPRFVAELAPQCDPSHDVVSCDADWLDENSRALVISWRYDAVELRATPLSYLIGHPMSLNNTIIRRTLWDKAGGCDETLAIWEDADLHVRLAREDARFCHVPQVLSIALRRGESLSHDYRRNWLCRLAALEGYIANPAFAGCEDVIAAEVEKAAAALATLRLDDAARRAVALCRRLGRRPPTTRHPLFRFLKPLVPAHTLLRWQADARRRAAQPKPNP